MRRFLVAAIGLLLSIPAFAQYINHRVTITDDRWMDGMDWREYAIRRTRLADDEERDRKFWRELALRKEREEREAREAKRAQWVAAENAKHASSSRAGRLEFKGLFIGSTVTPERFEKILTTEPDQPMICKIREVNERYCFGLSSIAGVEAVVIGVFLENGILDTIHILFDLNDYDVVKSALVRKFGEPGEEGRQENNGVDSLTSVWITGDASQAIRLQNPIFIEADGPESRTPIVLLSFFEIEEDL